MPEGPEVRRSADMLAQHLVGRQITEAFCAATGRYAEKPPEGYRDFIDDLREYGPCTVSEVDAKGKFLWWKLSFPAVEKVWWMWNTYGMSGQWSKHATKYAAFGIHLGLEQRLYFNDIRHFGTLKFVDSETEHQRKLSTLGPDMLKDPPPQESFDLRLGMRMGKTLAEALMDQSVISGVGNYVKAEALYLAELSPHRLVSSLLENDRKRLREQIINVMKASYNTGGATISTYRNVDGTKGEAQRRFCVYGCNADPLGNPVVREETRDGRTTHWVPSVQK